MFDKTVIGESNTSILLPVFIYKTLFRKEIEQ